MSGLVVTEGVASMWHYHLSEEDAETRSLCGKPVMRTMVPISYWDKTPADYHIPESWCADCGKRLSTPDDDAEGKAKHGPAGDPKDWDRP